MKLTNLQLTQSILSSLGGDEVNSVSDSPESLQVLEIIRQSYFNMIDKLDLPETWQLVQLQPSLDINAPVLMYVPAEVAKVEWIKYFNTNILDDANGYNHDINVDIVPSPDVYSAVPGYEYVTILPIRQFIDMTNGFNPSETDVFSFTLNNKYTFYYKNGKQPQYCTILSNNYVIFDGYDATQDSTLQASKTMAYGQIKPTWSNEDDFICDLNDEQFPLLLNEAKSLAFLELKQVAHPLAEREIKRGRSAIQRDKAVHESPSYFDALPDFGRRGIGHRAPISLFKSRGWDT